MLGGEAVMQITWEPGLVTMELVCMCTCWCKSCLYVAQHKNKTVVWTENLERRKCYWVVWIHTSGGGSERASVFSTPMVPGVQCRRRYTCSTIPSPRTRLSRCRSPEIRSSSSSSKMSMGLAVSIGSSHSWLLDSLPKILRKGEWGHYS